MLFNDVMDRKSRNFVIHLDFAKIKPLILKRYKSYKHMSADLEACLQSVVSTFETADKHGILIYKPNWPNHYTIVSRLLKQLDLDPSKFEASETKVKRYQNV